MNNKIVTLIVGLSLLGVSSFANADNHSDMEMMETTSMDMTTTSMPSKAEMYEENVAFKMLLSEDDNDMVEEVLYRYNNITSELNSAQKNSINNRFVEILDENIEAGISTRISYVLTLVKNEILTWAYMWTEVWENTLSSFDSIAQNAMNTGLHDTLVTALEEADLADTMMNDGPFTVFAPVDSAFGELPEGTVENLLMEENMDDLVDLLSYHVVTWVYLAEDITEGLNLETLQWEMIEFNYMDGAWYVDGQEIILADVYSSNGVIHAIDWVMMP